MADSTHAPGILPGTFFLFCNWLLGLIAIKQSNIMKVRRDIFCEHQGRLDICY